MAQKKGVLGTQAIKSLKEQAKRFGAISVMLSKRADLATKEANEIAVAIAHLISILRRIQQDTQREAEVYRQSAEKTIHELRDVADSRKRKTLEDAKLDSRTTIKNNFRSIFGSWKERDGSCQSTQYAHKVTMHRIDVIRDLSNSHPHGVITFVLSHPSKVWKEANTTVFNGLIQSIKQETEQNWPAEILDIMDDLKEERQMVAEFSKLYSMTYGSSTSFLTEFRVAAISQRKRQCHQKVGDSAPVSLNDEDPSRRFRNSGNGKHIKDGSQVSNQDGSEKSKQITADSISPSSEQREMKHMYTSAPASNIEKFSEPFKTCIQNSKLWKWERSQRLETTECWASLFPKDHAQDVSFTVWCGHKDGYRLNEAFGLQLALSSEAK